MLTALAETTRMVPDYEHYVAVVACLQASLVELIFHSAVYWCDKQLQHWQ